jgi:hypothetical protein
MTLKVYVAEKYRREKFVAEGKEVPAHVELEVPLAGLTPDARRALLCVTTHGPEGANVLLDPGSEKPYAFPLLPETLADWEHALAAYNAEQDSLEEMVASRAAEAALAYLAGGSSVEVYCTSQGHRGLREVGPAGSSWDIAWLTPEMREDVVAEEERRRAAAQAEKAAQEAERARWIEVNGSAHLRCAVGSGYNCQRRYVKERHALEHPDYHLDWGNQAQWKARACPSPEALDEALAVGGRVVWLTRPSYQVPVEDGTYEPVPWPPREAVVIAQYLGKHTLIREFPPD